MNLLNLWNFMMRVLNWAKVNRRLIAEKFSKASGIKIVKKLYGLTHNFIERKGDVYIHRKGSIPSDNGPAIIPGSRGTYSYLVESSSKTLHSLPHGAGKKIFTSTSKRIL